MSTLSVDTIQGKTMAANVDLPSGTIVQQVNSVDSGTADRPYQSTNSTSFTHMSNFDLTITPKFSSSKILYIGAFNFYAASGAGYGYMALYQHISGGSAARVATHASGSAAISNSIYFNVPIVHMMTPNTTNAITYKIYTRSNSTSGSVYTGWNSSAGSLDNVTNYCALEIRA